MAIHLAALSWALIFILRLHSIWVICFSRIVKLTRGVFFIITTQHNKLSCPLKVYFTMFSRAGNINFLSGQDEFHIY